MKTVHVESEQDTEIGWVFSCRIQDPDGTSCSITFGLSWADYDLWTPDGTVPPERVAAAVLSLLLEQTPDSIHERLDAACVRRLIPGADDLLKARVRNTGF